MKNIYKVTNRFGLGLSQFTIEAETKKLYIVASSKDVYGFTYVGRQVKKDDPLVFDNVGDAMLRLYELAERRAEQARERFDETIQERDKIANIIREANKVRDEIDRAKAEQAKEE